jgi:cytochrome c peroxidase
VGDGPHAGDGRANPFKDPLVSGIDLSARDRTDLVAFLESLTDRAIANDPRFTDPRRR